MYKKHFSFEIFMIKPSFELNLMYSKGVEVDEQYLFTEENFEFYLISFE